jgi:hypothetical protein
MAAWQLQLPDGRVALGVGSDDFKAKVAAIERFEEMSGQVIIDCTPEGVTFRPRVAHFSEDCHCEQVCFPIAGRRICRRTCSCPPGRCKCRGQHQFSESKMATKTRRYADDDSDLQPLFEVLDGISDPAQLKRIAAYLRDKLANGTDDDDQDFDDLDGLQPGAGGSTSSNAAGLSPSATSNFGEARYALKERVDSTGNRRKYLLLNEHRFSAGSREAREMEKALAHMKRHPNHFPNRAEAVETLETAIAAGRSAEECLGKM